MKFKSLFLSLCLLFVAATAFAGTPDATFDNGDEPLTLKAANKLIYAAMAEVPADAEVQIVSVSSILKYDDAECSVTATVDIAGNGVSVTATAETCRQAIAMIADIINL